MTRCRRTSGSCSRPCAKDPARRSISGAVRGELGPELRRRGYGYVNVDLVPDGPNAIVGDAGRLPFADGAFSLVVSSDTLEHFPDPASALAEARRVLAPGGSLVVWVPFLHPFHGDDLYRYTPLGLRKLLEGAGFVVEAIEAAARARVAVRAGARHRAPSRGAAGPRTADRAARRLRGPRDHRRWTPGERVRGRVPRPRAADDRGGCGVRLLLVTGIYPPDIGGPATHTADLRIELLDRGHDVVVLTLGDDAPTVPPSDVRAGDVVRLSRSLPWPARLALVAGWIGGAPDAVRRRVRDRAAARCRRRRASGRHPGRRQGRRRSRVGARPPSRTHVGRLRRVSLERRAILAGASDGTVAERDAPRRGCDHGAERGAGQHDPRVARRARARRGDRQRRRATRAGRTTQGPDVRLRRTADPAQAGRPHRRGRRVGPGRPPRGGRGRAGARPPGRPRRRARRRGSRAVPRRPPARGGDAGGRRIVGARARERLRRAPARRDRGARVRRPRRSRPPWAVSRRS